VLRVLAQTAGFMRVDPPPRIKEAMASQPWRNGDLRLDLLVISGVRVDTDQEIASIVSSTGSEVHESEIASVERAFTVRTETALERCSELCVTLCSQLPLLVRTGDPGGAARVLRVLLDLLDAHTAADTRQWAQTEGLLQMSPVIVETVNQALTDIRNADADAEREMTGFLVALINRAGRDDGLPGLISMKLRGARLSRSSTFSTALAVGPRSPDRTRGSSQPRQRSLGSQPAAAKQLATRTRSPRD
jgi:hypothetical protein